MIKCSNCRFWVPNRHNEETGRCHRFPPSFGKHDYPPTFDEDWCGEFSDKIPDVFVTDAFDKLK